MKLVIFDPGFTDSHGHHKTVNLAIHQSWADKGLTPLIIAARTLDDATKRAVKTMGLLVMPYFVTPSYPYRANALSEQVHSKLAEQFSSEIIQLYDTGVLSGDENVLVHTGFSFHWSGLAKAIEVVETRLSGAVLVTMMFHPGARLDKHSLTLTLLDHREYYRHQVAFEQLYTAGGLANIAVILATSCRAYQSVYQRLWPYQVQIHPSVVFRDLPSYSKQQASKCVLLYLGSPKVNKGILFSADIGILAAQTYPDIQFLFHFNAACLGAENFTAKIAELGRAGLLHRNVKIFIGNLENIHYDALIQASDVICILYDPVEYAFKTSGVFWEALRNEAIQWLVTEQTWMAAELDELGLKCAKVTYGDTAAAVTLLGQLVEQATQSSMVENTHIDENYRQTLNSPFGDWLMQCATLPSRPNITGKRILMVYADESVNSAVCEVSFFIPILRSLGYQVDELKVASIHHEMKNTLTHVNSQLNLLASSCLTTYHAHAALCEIEIQRCMHQYDIVHFFNAEQCGVLSALFKHKNPTLSQTQLIATYRSSEIVLREVIIKPDFLQGFERIHLISSEQMRFFKPLLSEDKLSMIAYVQQPLVEAVNWHLVAYALHKELYQPLLHKHCKTLNKH